MKIFYQICIILVLFFSVSFPANAIKIGLLEDQKTISTGVSTAGSIYDATTGKGIMKLQAMSKYILKNSRTTIQIKINGKFYPLHSKNIKITTNNNKGFVLAKERWYRQSLIVMKTQDGLTVINDIDLELYLCGVVPSEMPSKWHTEAHKAQAIAARSYALANLGKRSSKGYDLKDTPEDQAYGGASSETAKTTKAVSDTLGQVLVHNGKIIPAYYHASAGGKTKNSGKVWNKNLPYIHSVPSFDRQVGKSGHGVGMSQYGANYLANKGYNAYQILGYFYTNVRLRTLPQ